MRKTLTISLAGLFLVAVAGLAWSEGKPALSPRPKLAAPRDTHSSAPATTVKAAATFPVIGYIEKRDRTITIKAGSQGPVYSVKTAEGKVLFENVTQEQLVAQAPELGEYLKTAIAGTAGTKRDARVRVIRDASLGGFGGR